MNHEMEKFGEIFTCPKTKKKILKAFIHILRYVYVYMSDKNTQQFITVV